LLDPAAAPPAQVALADGLIGATAFFILQGVALLIIADDLAQPGMRALTLSFISAGTIVYLLMRLYYWRSKTTGVPAILHGGTFRAALLTAAPTALIAILCGLGYLTAIRHSELAPMLGKGATITDTHRNWLLGLAVLAAPLCEEFLFRGLIFGGLRRSMAVLPSAVLSAAIFAIVHPPIAMLPVFILGLCTAWSYQRSKTLLAPMLVHALYNAAMVML
ncbi:MAG: CPBP family intramembrane metalloprotease, partial [Burkholderiaceae bacterium]|nr:CPBP family intramembrane metalloprotease [Burkholderiaceae bacterium]